MSMKHQCPPRALLFRVVSKYPSASQNTYQVIHRFTLYLVAPANREGFRSLVLAPSLFSFPVILLPQFRVPPLSKTSYINIWSPDCKLLLAHMETTAITWISAGVDYSTLLPSMHSAHYSDVNSLTASLPSHTSST